MQKPQELNDVKNRFLFISPSVSTGLEREAKISDFLLTTVLGTGATGKVYLAQHKITQGIYAIKEIDKTNKQNDYTAPYFRREIEIMYKIKHPNIVKLFGHFEEGNFCYFIMEYIPKGNLYNAMIKQKSQCFDSGRVATIMKDLISAVYYIHNMSPPIVHRDIKPENLLVTDDGRIKLTDFGWSNYVEYFNIRSTFCGTPYYLAPEIIKKIGHNISVDIWCIGALIFEFLTGKCPFSGQSDNEIFENVLKNKIDWPKDINLEAKNLISKILKNDPKERISLQEMLKHPFFTNNVANSDEFMFKPNEMNIDEQNIYVICRDSPQNIPKFPVKKKDGNDFQKDYVNTVTNTSNLNLNPTSTSPNFGINSNYSNYNVNSNTGNIGTNPYIKYSSDNNIITSTNNSNNTTTLNNPIINNSSDNFSGVNIQNLQEKYNQALLIIDGLRKENEQIKLKEKFSVSDKDSLIREKDEQENQKLNLQMKLSQFEYKIFEYEEKIKNLNSVIKSNEMLMERDKNFIDSLQKELENTRKSKDDTINYYIKKIETFEESLREANSKKKNQIDNDISYFRKSLKGYMDSNDYSYNKPTTFGYSEKEKPIFQMSTAANSNTGSYGDCNFLNNIEMLQKDFSEERNKYDLIIKNKEDEITRLKSEKSNYNSYSDFYHYKNLCEKYQCDLIIKNSEIEYLNKRLLRIENVYK